MFDQKCLGHKIHNYLFLFVHRSNIDVRFVVFVNHHQSSQSKQITLYRRYVYCAANMNLKSVRKRVRKSQFLHHLLQSFLINHSYSSHFVFHSHNEKNVIDFCFRFIWCKTEKTTWRHWWINQMFQQQFFRDRKIGKYCSGWWTFRFGSRSMNFILKTYNENCFKTRW